MVSFELIRELRFAKLARLMPVAFLEIPLLHRKTSPAVNFFRDFLVE